MWILYSFEVLTSCIEMIISETVSALQSKNRNTNYKSHSEAKWEVKKEHLSKESEKN
jgi:hypothetical protein